MKEDSNTYSSQFLCSIATTFHTVKALILERDGEKLEIKQQEDEQDSPES